MSRALWSGRAEFVLLLALLGQVAPAVASSVTYYHTDALGTPVAVTDQDRNVLERSEYEPYGKVLNRPATDGPGYTAHVTDAATGLSYMQQRYYDPGVGRFLSVDPVTANGGTGANFNRYWYATDNPYRFKDPDGRCTGTHICNQDGTAVSTGGYTTGAGGALQGLEQKNGAARALVKYQSVIATGKIDIHANVSAAHRMGNDNDIRSFIAKVRTGGDWDYKNKSEFSHFKDRALLAEFGNYHFGLVARAFGFSLGETIAGAGIYQTFFQGHSAQFRAIGRLDFGLSLVSVGLLPGGFSFFGSDHIAEVAGSTGVQFGDYPEDTRAIIGGYRDEVSFQNPQP